VGLPIDSNVFTAPERAPSSWPFRSAPHMHDSQVSDQGVGIPARQEVEFKDGTRIWLRRVIDGGAPHLFLRELGEPAEGARIDLRWFIDDVATELPKTSTRDVAGFVAFSLRGRFATRELFLHAVATQGRPE
jgi:hypothetical protein